MSGSLACILSYGLTCSPAPIEAVPLPAAEPLDPVEAVAPASTPTEEASASGLLARVQGFYATTEDLKTAFVQTYMHPVYGTKKVSKGTLRARKPGMMIWDYESKDNADYWVEGDRLTIVEQATRQVIREELGAAEIAGAEQFLFGSRSLTEDFLVKLAGADLEKTYGKPDHTAIRLKPKRANQHYKEILLVVANESGRVDAFVVLNQDKSTNHFELSSLMRNQGLAPDDFKFKMPAGYKEISVR